MKLAAGLRRLHEGKIQFAELQAVQDAAAEDSIRDGVVQMCFMGVINPLTPQVETPEHVRVELLAAARHIPVERLGATDDCGFSPFSRDVRPRHGSPDFARDVAMQKIAARLEGTAMAYRELGV